MQGMPVEITNFFLSMQLGKAAADALRATFTDDAIYEEPFSGTPRRHEGIDAIMAVMGQGWEYPMQDTRIEINSVAVSGSEVTVGWTCFSPSLPGGSGSGRNQFTLRNGRISKLVTTLEG